MLAIQFKLILYIACCSPVLAQSFIVDAIVATVGGEPITFSEVIELMPGTHLKTIDEAKNDPAFKAVMESVISEKLLELEAVSRRINVTEAEVGAYVNGVAEKNQLTLEEFAKALEQEGKSIDIFKRSIKSEILRNKISASLVQEGVAISDQELDQHLVELSAPETDSHKRVKLRQILISTDNRFITEAQDQCQDLHKQLQSGVDFADLARKHSDGDEAKDGGSLGVIAEKDLNPTIFDAILTLNKGEFSTPVETEAGCQIFLLEDRFDHQVKSDKKSLRAELRKQIERQKMEERYQTYFSTEVYKNHTVERKV